MKQRSREQKAAARRGGRATVRDVRFSDKAHLDEDAMWPTRSRLEELSAAEEERIAELVMNAVS